MDYYGHSHLDPVTGGLGDYMEATLLSQAEMLLPTLNPRLTNYGRETLHPTSFRGMQHKDFSPLPKRT